MVEQQFCLHWNNHQNTLVSIFDTLRQSDRFTDCTLSAEGHNIAVHKILLTACSPYFGNILKDIQNDRHPVIILRDVKLSELQAIIDYMYRGEVNVSQDTLGPILKVADSLQIKGLFDNRTRTSPRSVSPQVEQSVHDAVEESNEEQDKKGKVPKAYSADPTNTPTPSRKRLRRTNNSESSPSRVKTSKATSDNTANNASVSKSNKLPDKKRINVRSAKKSVYRSAALNEIVKRESESQAVEMLQPKEEFVAEEDESEEGVTLYDDNMGISEAGPSYRDQDSPSQGSPLRSHCPDESSDASLFIAAQEAASGKIMQGGASHFSLKTCLQYFTCTNCDKKYMNQKTFTDHIMKGCTGKIHQCVPCQKNYRHKNDLTKHFKYECGKDIRCPSCNKKYNSVDGLRYHIKNLCNLPNL